MIVETPRERRASISLNFQNYIDHSPIPPAQLHASACSSDEVTINAWRKTWTKNVSENHKRFGPFKDKTIGKIHNLFRYQPVIVAGAGPSLKFNGHLLKHREDIGLVSCLHNFHFMEDNELNPDFYVTLDAGDVTIEEVYEGGAKTQEEYWALTKGRTLLAYIGSSPRLLEKWQGEILFYNCPVPDDEYMKHVESVEPFHVYAGTGGNVLGASMYIAKAFLGCGPLIFVGADFSFSYENKFHAWDSKYDAKLGNVVTCRDVFGIPVNTWQSYYNFKNYFDCIAETVPGIFINCSEGGCLGAYPDGNIRSVRQMTLGDCLNMFNMNAHIKEQIESPHGALDEKGNVIKKLLF